MFTHQQIIRFAKKGKRNEFFLEFRKSMLLNHRHHIWRKRLQINYFAIVIVFVNFDCFYCWLTLRFQPVNVKKWREKKGFYSKLSHINIIRHRISLYVFVCKSRSMMSVIPFSGHWFSHWSFWSFLFHVIEGCRGGGFYKFHIKYKQIAFNTPTHV